MRLLSQSEVNELPEGADIFVRWPESEEVRRYQVTHRPAGSGSKGRCDFPLASQNGCVRRILKNVGERPGIEVWLPNEKTAASRSTISGKRAAAQEAA